MRSTLLAVLSVLPAVMSASSKSILPVDKIYGVNLGSWLLIEPWMLPAEWVSMGGEICNDCSTCVMSEGAFAKAHPDTVDATFDKHWTSWFNQADIDKMVEYGINTVRIPLGFWIVEPLVNRTTENYARGGMKQLKRGLRQLKAAGITAILDHHALPGVASPGQMFAGVCTQNVQFYTPENYQRALVWSSVMTALSHIDPDFSSVYSIQAMNEPIQDANRTPNLGQFYENFAQVIRATEACLGIHTEGFSLQSFIAPSFNLNVTASITTGSQDAAISAEVAAALRTAAPMIAQIAKDIGSFDMFHGRSWPSRQPLVANYMDVNWQYNNPANPADTAIGPSSYDNHLYYSFGGVADANPDAYLTNICNRDLAKTDAALGNAPLFEGEWAVPTNFDATDDFLKKFADAQKISYSKGAGWIFWNFKFEDSPEAQPYPRFWSYFNGIELGYLTKDPSQVNDPHVCDPYITTSSSVPASTPKARL